MGFTWIEEAGDDRQAIELLRRHPYDLLISGWRMPRLDACGVLKALCRPECPRTPVLLIAVSPSDAADTAGSDAVLAKPFSPAELLVAVHRVLAAPVRRPLPESVARTSPWPPVWRPGERNVGGRDGSLSRA